MVGSSLSKEDIFILISWFAIQVKSKKSEYLFNKLLLCMFKISNDWSKVKIFDPNLNRLKKLEYQRAQKKIVYDDDVKLNKAYKFTRFFKKEV